ncbi:conserved hypothetical protein [Talaromyces stipitatus ATCC 10500]|uniref:Uncharacterized protein n=1 Tax=Talaromyces stipitatus (strain ATCC 10500 / CBS 375.48 / QM 6759 / NRRL 1006) TaxID=441959 RepID=B8MKP8_TALSN|nr:uncharacterized protein TSTA_043680 [Talaromyces stipitatus ATCC 10500]EED14897.1 conserved hypothetical protein [Talaromyces stipitatus ATCC 10500]
MAVTQKLYPRGTVKRIVKARAGRNISKNADVLITCYSCKSMRPIPNHCTPFEKIALPPFDYILTYPNHRLMREASIRSRKSGEKGISARNIRRVTEVSSYTNSFSIKLSTLERSRVADSFRNLIRLRYEK